tara:strand:+ start:486 stop:1352 length:867 start_codon:yes stop_codon:yes gene_type:complete
MNITEFIEKKFPKKIILSGVKNEDLERSNWYYENSKADAIYGFYCISKHLNKNIKILEVGGGLHFLSNFLNQEGYNIDSLEPGEFSQHINIMRTNILKISSNSNINIITTDLEKFSDENTNGKYDFIFSINVLEHAKDIKTHIKKCVFLLSSNNGLLSIRCPNYLFPFETHFYKFFIPFFPRFTFEKLRKKKLIKTLGEKRYLELFNHINFNCDYRKIKKFGFNIKFLNPLKDIFDRIETDIAFRNRLFSNKLIKIIYKIIMIFKLKQIIIKLFPISFNPYMIMEIKR